GRGSPASVDRRDHERHGGRRHSRRRPRPGHGLARPAPGGRAVAGASGALSRRMAIATASDSPAAVVRGFLDHLAVERGASTNTLAAYRRDLTRYVTYL